MASKRERPQVVLLPQLCKGCGRCIEACPKHGISFGTEIEQASGFIPVHIDYNVCNHCGLCVSACPEPYGLSTEKYELEDPEKLFGPRKVERRRAETIEPRRIPLPQVGPMVLKGNFACAVGALLATSPASIETALDGRRPVLVLRAHYHPWPNTIAD